MVDVDLAGVGSSLQQQVEEKKGRKKMRRGTSEGGGAGRDKVGGKSDGLGGARGVRTRRLTETEKSSGLN